MSTMTEADLQDLLLRVESAMLREDVDGWCIQRVINTLVYGEPGAPDAIYNTAEGRTLQLQRALAQARAHERALDRLQSELRSAGEAYAYASAMAVRDAAMDLVAQLRDDLGDKDPDLIAGEVVRGEPFDPGRETRALGAAMESMLSALGPSPLASMWLDTARAMQQRPEPAALSCYDASFGRVHVQPGCRCPR
jgi:hypothetical protein